MERLRIVRLSSQTARRLACRNQELRGSESCLLSTVHCLSPRMGISSRCCIASGFHRVCDKVKHILMLCWVKCSAHGALLLSSPCSEVLLKLWYVFSCEENPRVSGEANVDFVALYFLTLWTGFILAIIPNWFKKKILNFTFLKELSASIRDMYVLKIKMRIFFYRQRYSGIHFEQLQDKNKLVAQTFPFSLFLQRHLQES